MSSNSNSNKLKEFFKKQIKRSNGYMEMIIRGEHVGKGLIFKEEDVYELIGVLKELQEKDE